MSALPTRIEREAGRPLTPLQIFDITAARETTLSRLLMLYISTGLLFMLLPGTFLGVWNLLAISSHHATARTVWPEQSQAFATAQFERDAIDGSHLTEALDHRFNLQRQRRGWNRPGWHRHPAIS